MHRRSNCKKGKSWCGSISLALALLPIGLIVLYATTLGPYRSMEQIFMLGVLYILPEVVALVLGIAGILQKPKQRIAALYGTAISSNYLAFYVSAKI